MNKLNQIYILRFIIFLMGIMSGHLLIDYMAISNQLCRTNYGLEAYATGLPRVLSCNTAEGTQNFPYE